jgi:hypothetical protein
MEKTQREYYLNEQMKAIQKELGDGEDGRDEMAELEERIAKTKLSKEAREKAEAEIKKLKQMSPMSAEATVVRNYLDWLLGCRGARNPDIKIDLNAAEKVLDDRSLRPRKGQGADHRVSRRAGAHRKDQGADPLPRRSSRRRQDLACRSIAEGHGARICAHGAGRRS